MRKIQSPSSEDSADGGSGKDRSHHHHSVTSTNGTNSKKSENGSSAVHQRHRSKIHLENLTSPTSGSNGGSGDKPKPLILELVIQKDKYGYGMKVSGENPVFVDSVKDGGAAHRAGLNAADMILRVNGHNVRYSTHAEVVQHMKATQNVELTVQRNARNFAMPTSGMSSNLGTPTTPTSQRNSITAPLPVDHLKRKEVEYTKLHTLYMMLEQEKKNLEKLREHESQNGGEIAKAEANIRTLQEQLRQSTNDSSTASLMAIITTASSKVTATATTTSSVTAPTFLARFPRSLSQLNLGSKRKSSAASPQEPVAKPLPPVASQNSSSSSSTPVSSPSHQQKIRVRHQHPTVTADVPPPLPQRNAPRKSLPTSPTNTPQISDLDASLMSAGIASAPFGSGIVVGVGGGAGSKKKNKQKIKAYSDPKMSSEIMLQMECASYQPPPLPPRPLFEDGVFGQVVTNKDILDSSGGEGRALPNSVATQLNYPVIATAVAVRDGIIPPNFHHHHHHSFEGGMTTSSCSLPDNTKAKKDGKNRDGSGPEVSPPGTPPPPYHMNASPASISAAQTNIEQRAILSFECDNETDDEALAEDDGVFRSISMLTAPENVAYLVVFLNFVLSNSKPAAILFYLITDLYKKGSVKEMRKWAYEIHSTFLVPTAPLSVFPITDVQSESLARDIDDKLAQAKNYHLQDRGNQQDFEMGGLLRNVFQKSRSRARDTINRQMEEFQDKRTAGLGTMYGPSGPELAAAKGNKQSESKIVEDFLMPKLTVLLDECDAASGIEESTVSAKVALTSALSTVVHKVFLPRGGAVSGSERVHHYVTREKSFKSRLISKNRKALVRGHNLSLRQYYETTHCNHCQNLMWGVAPQGFTCAHCGLNVHRTCAKLLEETCPGPVNVPVDKFTKFMDRIREKGHGMQNAKKQEEELGAPWDDAVTSDRSASFSARAKGDIQFQRPAHASSSTSQLQSHPDSSQTDFHQGGSNSTITSSIGGSSGVISGSPQGNHGHEGSGDHSASDGKRGKQKTSQPNARSESYKECSPKRSRSNRPKSDPSLYEDDASSQVDHHQDDVSNTSITTTPGRPHTGTSLESSPATTDDESFEGWNAEMFQQLTETEKKRQEIINELFETEKNHVKILRTLHIKFMVPLEQNKTMTSELIQLVFPPAFLVLKEWHNSFIGTLKQRWREHNALIKDIGDCLNVFDGPSGDLLKEHAARFCARQQIALEVLKERRGKDEDLKAALIKAEAHPDCNRHKLQDLLVTVLQRLTKYPLLFERLHRCSEGSEAEAIKKALDASKAILDYVNHAVRIAEDLRSIQRKLDKASYDKEAPKEFKNIDLTKYKLIHDGLLLIKKDDKKDDQKAIQLRVLLFDNMIVLLQKQDDKYLLKQFPNPLAPAERSLVNPITKVGNLFARQNQSERQSFFLIDLSQENSQQLLKLTAPNEEESIIWIEKITDAAERANKLKKVQQKPLPAVPPLPPPQALEETPENLLDAPPDEPAATQPEEPEAPADEKEEEPSELPQEDPNAVSTTQPCQLIQPSEISVAAQTVQEAALVVTPEESLRRHGQHIEESVNEMERIICDINRVPPEHFAEIADIAAQPEAASDLAGLAMAAFAQSKFLVESLRTAMLSSLNSVALSSFGGPALCDNCTVPAEFRSRSASEPLAPISTAGGMEVDIEVDTDGDNLYCEIEPIKDNGVTKDRKIVSHMEINENYSCVGENKTTSIIKVEKIAASITTLNSLVSQLTIKIAERDQEREVYKRENQRLRQQLHLIQDDEIVSNTARELSTEKCEQNEQPEP